jgi:hypothetical protein
MKNHISVYEYVFSASSLIELQPQALNDAPAENEEVRGEGDGE